MKLITIKSEETPKVGDVAEFNDKLWIVKEINPELNIPCLNVDLHLSKKCLFYIVDKTAEIKEGDYVNYEESKIQRLLYVYDDPRKAGCIKVIATNDNSIPLPQLSKQDIELIVEKNGELDEFDVDFGNGNTSCHNCSLNTKYEPNICINIKECAINNKHFIPKANIILKETEIYNSCKHNNKSSCEQRSGNCYESSTNETLEEVAYNYCKAKSQFIQNHLLFQAALKRNIELFIAGYKHAESKMYSEMDMFDTMQKFCEDNKIKVSLLIEWFSKNVSNKK